ncbi:MAG: hypothetical protein CMN74_05550 [Sphingorhabdus sp.]|nr:hypothetical protein [Sphingorhabdus sp.]|tara:strand:+ start:2637 stop:3746 length:1110 start_codon:yes stop_codon:yes gene_type:complete
MGIRPAGPVIEGSSPARRHSDGGCQTIGSALDPANAPPRLSCLLASAPFADGVRSVSFRHHAEGFYDYAVAIPARNEIALLPRALAALGRTMDACRSQRGVVVLVVNDSDDGSADLFGRWAETRNAAFALAEIGFNNAIRDAPHARRFAMDIAAQFTPHGAILTTDADSHVGPNWIEAFQNGLKAGYDLLCEDVRLDETELGRLPDSVRAVGALERRYFELCEELWQRWTGRGPFAVRASGASMAIRTPVYHSLGGLPTPRVGEDSALAVNAQKAEYRVFNCGDLGTRTSARLHGRAAGGCGEALRQRACEADPACDGSLVPLSVLRSMADEVTEGVELAPSSRAPMRASEVRHQLQLAERLLTPERAA